MNNTILIAGVAILLIIGLVVVTQMGGEDEITMDDTMMGDDAAMDDTVNTEAGVMVGGALMVPTLDIVDNAMNASNVTTLLAAVAAAGLVDTLKSAGPFTVFAPTNAAFEAMPSGTVESLLLPENRAQLVDILTYHVVPGTYTLSDMTDGQTLSTVQGEVLTIGRTGSEVTINGSAMVETADVVSSNGVTFVIDGVLLPTGE